MAYDPPTKEALYRALRNSYLAKHLSPSKLSAYLELASVEEGKRAREQTKVNTFLSSHMMTLETGPLGSSLPFHWKHVPLAEMKDLTCQHCKQAETSKHSPAVSKSTDVRQPFSESMHPSTVSAPRSSLPLQDCSGHAPRTISTDDQEQTTAARPARLLCPWCFKPFKNKSTLTEHMREICASRTVYLCECGVASRSELMAEVHRFQESPACLGKVFEKRTLTYDRQAFGCRWDESLFTSLDAFKRHILKDCKGCSTNISKKDPSLLIRALLRQDCFKEKVNELCTRMRKPLDSLWWSNTYPVNRFIESLEFGERGARNEMNCGIPSEDVDKTLFFYIRSASLTPVEL